MSPRPTPAVMDDYYSHSENYKLWGEFIFPASEARRRDKICRPLLDAMLDACRHHGVAPGHLMEVGPGFGTFAALAKSSGAFARVSAVERTPAMAEACRRQGIDVFESAVEDIPEDFGDPADVLAFFEVIEHIFDPAAFLKIGARLLRRGGLLVLTCPNGNGFDTQVLGARSVAVDTEHVNLFNPGSLSLLLDRLGFDVLEAATPGRLDAELVREAILDGDFDVSRQPFLQQLLVDEFDRLGPPFQRFLAEQGLSGNMRLIARKR
jgi:SAM-dependent methyltransferase